MMAVNQVLSGRVAVVTGAGRGIGRAISLALGDAGAKVVLASRTVAELEETASYLEERGYHNSIISTDVSVWESVQNLTAHVVKEFGHIDILVNNAGIQGAIGPLVENDPALWAKTIQVNLLGTFYCCKAVLPYMIQQSYGSIINLSGGGATSPRVNYSAYSASKAAVVRLTETLAEEVREYNIRVNAIAPGAVNTHMLKETLEAEEDAGEKEIAEAKQQLQTGGTPPELAANLDVYLASDASDSLTGKLIAAPHDGWENWGTEHVEAIMSAPWFTLRRMDPYTIEPLITEIEKISGR